MSWLPIYEQEFPVYLGLDWGEKRIGLATAPHQAIQAGGPALATPLGIVQQHAPRAHEQVKALLGHRVPVEAVCGLPLNERGEDSLRTLEVRSFLSRFVTLVGELYGRQIPIHFVDERFSTAAALASRRSASQAKPQSRGKARHVPARELRIDIDAQVAAELLQGWLAGQRP